MNDVYLQLADHLKDLVMGYPFSQALLDLLRESFTPDEARVALAIPNNLMPMEVVDATKIAERSGLPAQAVSDALQSLSARNMLYTAKTGDGKVGYALMQIGYGMPQTFFWAGRQDDRARRMAKLVLNYFTVPITGRIYGGVATKTYKYTPTNASIYLPMQGVMPNEQIGTIVNTATKIAVAHCPCRMSAKVLGRTDCEHSLEVCLKYDELAEFVIAKGLARKISKDEAREILGRSEKEGLVHMVDNAQGQIKHTCNCCGHYCWNVGIIKRRKISRDVLMAVYFIRETALDACIGCGACVEICPVTAVEVIDDLAQVDLNWCIGCGVCAVTCPTEAISIKRRTEENSPSTFADLHRRIKQERGLGE